MLEFVKILYMDAIRMTILTIHLDKEISRVVHIDTNK